MTRYFTLKSVDHVYKIVLYLLWGIPIITDEKNKPIQENFFWKAKHETFSLNRITISIEFRKAQFWTLSNNYCIKHMHLKLRYIGINTFFAHKYAMCIHAILSILDLQIFKTKLNKLKFETKLNKLNLHYSIYQWSIACQCEVVFKNNTLIHSY